MRIIPLLLFLAFLPSSTFGQSNEEKSSLRIKVDSIIRFQIGYISDSTTNKLPLYKWDSSKYKGLHPSFASLPPNPMTRIILDQQLIEIQELNSYSLSDIEILKVYGKQDRMAFAIYGSSAKNGVIILKRKR
ncbi:MAG: hypothetical protein AAFO07_11060 [Bacteroidota bacterium]